MKIKRIVATAAVAIIALTGCGTSASTSTGGSNADDGKKLTIAMITHAKAGDTFWDVVKSGGEKAGSDLGITVDYSSDPDPAKQSQLIENAIAKKVDGIVISMANPDGVQNAVKDAVKAKIPVVTINSGLEKSVAFGAMTHVGQSEELAGESAGKKFASLGAKHLLCVIHEAGNIGLEQRCRGAAKTFGGKVDNLQVDISNIADVQSTIASKLTADSSIDGVLTLNPEVAIAATQAITKASSKAQVGTFDVSKDITDAITAGKVAFAIDQQPYVQGYLPVVFIALHDRNGNDIGGGQPVYSGPAFITKENAATVAQYASKGTR